MEGLSQAKERSAEDPAPEGVVSGDDFGSRVLHVYGQAFEHQPVYIAGGEQALRALRDAIEAALVRQVADALVYASDGEGYRVHVLAMPPGQAERLVDPYSSDDAHREGGIDPFDWMALRVDARIDEVDLAILHELGGQGGYTSGQLAEQLPPTLGRADHRRSHDIYRRLCRMEKLGYVGRMDEETPIVWLRRKLPGQPG